MSYGRCLMTQFVASETPIAHGVLHPFAGSQSVSWPRAGRVLRFADMYFLSHCRLNYILWLEDLLTSTAPLQTPSSSHDPMTSRQMRCRGIDMYVLCCVRSIS